MMLWSGETRFVGRRVVHEVMKACMATVQRRSCGVTRKREVTKEKSADAEPSFIVNFICPFRVHQRRLLWTLAPAAPLNGGLPFSALGDRSLVPCDLRSQALTVPSGY